MNSAHVWNKIEGYEDWKIYPPYRIFYFECLKSAADSAIRSWEQINNIVTNQDLFDNHSFKLIDLAENIVNQAGIISRYFFPSVDRKNGDKNRIHQLRSEKLRELFSINRNSIIADRKFRNYIEHFDENLDQFLNQPIAGTIYPKLVFIDLSELNTITYLFKAYVVNQFKFISLNQELDLPPLIEEIYRIYNLCVEE
ncbi:MAG: hypothetical protein ACOVRK_13865 [Chryseobacterium taeanense]